MSKKKLFLFVIVVFVHCFSAHAQSNKYWIFFKDKDTSNYDCSMVLSRASIENRKLHHIPLSQYSDVPVNKHYVSEIQTLTGISPMVCTKWLNGISAFLTEEQKKEVEQLSFVKEVRSIDRNIEMTASTVHVDPAYMHVAMQQMGLSSFLKASLDGQGVNIGVIDAGFFMAQSDKYTSHLVSEGKIKAQRDFIDPSRKDLITVSVTAADEHGKNVLRMIGGYDEKQRVQFGMAPNASFFLARTENGDREHRLEEDHWIMAMEWLDSLGVRLISTSLGYAIKMDDPAENYTQDQMDGKTAAITKAVQMAYDQKGIFVVVSAGNEGSNPSWRIISAPADAKGALSVGATNDTQCDKIDYSSIGPENLPYIKPNVSCYSPNGTSFSCPAVAGFVACLMQKAPQLSNKELFEVMLRCSHLYPYGNNYVGYGIPQASRALELVKNINTEFKTTTKVEVKKSKYSLKKLNKEFKEVVLFNKKNETIVLNQELKDIKKGKLVVKREAGVERTTLAFPDYSVIEIVWQ